MNRSLMTTAPPVDGGPDQGGGVLGAGGGEEQGLGPGCHAAAALPEQDLPDRLPDRGSARLPGDHDVVPARP